MAEKAIYIEGNKIRINKRQLKIRIAAIALIIMLVYAAGEAAVRILEPQELYNRHNPEHPAYPKEVEYDKDLGWATKKGYKAEPYTMQGKHPVVTITHNSQGLRMDHEADQSKNIVAFTGDSLTYGFWVDDKKIVSARLNEMLGRQYEVINLGVGGYGTDQSFLRLLRDGVKYNPKIVVHGFFTNDFSNIVSNYQYDVYKPLFQASEGKLTLTNVPVPVSKNMEKSYPKIKEHTYKGFQRLMRSWSQLYVLYKNKIGTLKSKLFSKPAEKIDYFTAYKDGEMWSIEKEYTDVMQYSFQLNSMILVAYNDFAKKNNMTFVLVLVADRISVDREMQKATIERYNNVDENFFDFGKPYKLLEDFAKKQGINVVNLYPLFKEEFEKGNSMYLEGDHHLNDYGHELYAREVHKLLAEEGLV